MNLEPVRSPSAHLSSLAGARSLRASVDLFNKAELETFCPYRTSLLVIKHAFEQHLSRRLQYPVGWNS